MGAARSISSNARDTAAGRRVLWLGEGAPNAELQRALRLRGFAWQARRAGLPWPAARIAPLDVPPSGPASLPLDLLGRRLWVVRPPGADTSLNRALLDLRAESVIVASGQTDLDSVEVRDPDAVLVDPGDLSTAVETMRALWRHARLRWAPVLLAANGPERAPAVMRAVHHLSADLDGVRRRARQGDRFGLQLELLGPTRLLRALADAEQALRARIRTPHLHVDLELHEQTLAGVRGHYLRGKATLEGADALTALLAQPTGDVTITPLEEPELHNLGLPLEAALDSALRRNPAGPLHESAIQPAARVATASGVPAPGTPATTPGQSETSGTLQGLKGPSLRTARRAPTPAVPVPRPPDTLHGVSGEEEHAQTGETARASRPLPPMETGKVDTLVGVARAEKFSDTLAGASRLNLEREAERLEQLHGPFSLDLAHLDAAAERAEEAYQRAMEPRAEPQAPPRYEPQSAPRVVKGWVAPSSPPPHRHRPGWLAVLLLVGASAALAWLLWQGGDRADPKPAPSPKQAAPGAAAVNLEEPPQPSKPVAHAPRSKQARLAQADAAVSLGHRQRRRGELDAAWRSYARALRLHPGYPRALAGMTQTQLKQGRPEQALRTARALVRRAPRRAHHQRLLGDALARAGQDEAARRAWRKAARMGSKRARQRLR